jgi:hypothetical protein
MEYWTEERRQPRIEILDKTDRTKTARRKQKKGHSREKTSRLKVVRRKDSQEEGQSGERTV